MRVGRGGKGRKGEKEGRKGREGRPLFLYCSGGEELFLLVGLQDKEGFISSSGSTIFK